MAQERQRRHNLVHRAQAKGYVVKVLFFWLNSPEYPRKQIACGGKGTQTVVREESLFVKIQSYVK
jgi:predicted ABC-type ATPase